MVRFSTSYGNVTKILPNRLFHPQVHTFLRVPLFSTLKNGKNNQHKQKLNGDSIF